MVKVCFRLHANKYEELMHSLVKGATVLDHNKSPCQEDFIPDTQVGQSTKLLV